MKGTSVFIAGIIQGSIPSSQVHAQDYRRMITEIIAKHLEGARVYCPFQNHQNSLEYDDLTASKVFFDHITMASRADLLVTYLPEASMGTAVEMFAAHQAGRAIVTISPMSVNWTVRFLSHRMLDGLEEFERFAAEGGLRELLDEHYGP